MRLYNLAAIIILPTIFSSIHAEPVGRLFSSPRERTALDQLRQKIGKGSPAIIAPARQETADQITLDGFVKHSSGKTTTWINQVPQHGNENPQGISVPRANGKTPAIAMQLPSGKKLNLKAGQTFDVTKGKVSEVYEDSATALP